MGAVQIIKENYRHLSMVERKQLIQELVNDIDQEIAPALVAEAINMDKLKEKHPFLKLTGMWTKEEGDEIMKAIAEADWIDTGDND